MVIDVDIDVDSCFGCFKGGFKVSLDSNGIDVNVSETTSPDERP